MRIQIRSKIPAAAHLRRHGLERLRNALRHLEWLVERVIVRLEYVAHPAGRVGKRCTVELLVNGADTVTVNAAGKSWQDSFDAATAQVRRRVVTRLQQVALAQRGLEGRPSFLAEPGGNLMRSYPRNSPEAAARIVALVLIADDHACQSEFDALNRLDAARELGLEPDALPRIVQTLCEDLLLGDYASGSMLTHVDAGTMVSLMAEVDDPVLQRKVWRLAVSAARADGHLADGELAVLEAARRCWRFQESAPAPQTAPSAPRPV